MSSEAQSALESTDSIPAQPITISSGEESDDDIAFVGSSKTLSRPIK